MSDREEAERIAGSHGDLCNSRSRMRGDPLRWTKGGACTCEVEKRTQAIESALKKTRNETQKELKEFIERASELNSRGGHNQFDDWCVTCEALKVLNNIK